MTEPFYLLPDSIELDREEYRQLVQALDDAEKALTESPAADPHGRFRREINSAVATLSRQIWPGLDDL
jgi:hypothetical protein